MGSDHKLLNNEDIALAGRGGTLSELYKHHMFFHLSEYQPLCLMFKMYFICLNLVFVRMNNKLYSSIQNI